MRQRFREQLGALDSALEDARLFCGSPSPHNAFTRQVHDSVKPFQFAGTDRACVGVPGDIWSTGMSLWPDEAHHRVPICGQRGEERVTDQSAGARKQNAHHTTSVALMRNLTNAVILSAATVRR